MAPSAAKGDEYWHEHAFQKYNFKFLFLPQSIPVISSLLETKFYFDYSSDKLCLLSIYIFGLNYFVFKYSICTLYIVAA